MGEFGDYKCRDDAGDMFAAKHPPILSTSICFEDDVIAKALIISGDDKNLKNDEKAKDVSGIVGICEKKRDELHEEVVPNGTWLQYNGIYYVLSAVVFIIYLYSLPAWAIIMSENVPEKATLEKIQQAGTDMYRQANEGCQEEGKRPSDKIEFPEAPSSTNEKLPAKALTIEADDPASRGGEEATSPSCKVGDEDTPKSSETSTSKESLTFTADGTSSTSEIHSETAVEDSEMIKSQSSSKCSLLEQGSSIITSQRNGKESEDSIGASSLDHVMEVKSSNEEIVTEQHTILHDARKHSCSDGELEIDFKEFGLKDEHDGIRAENSEKPPLLDENAGKSKENSETCSAMGEFGDYKCRDDAGDMFAAKHPPILSTSICFEDDVIAKALIISGDDKNLKNDEKAKDVSGIVGICEKKRDELHEEVVPNGTWLQYNGIYYVLSAVVFIIYLYSLPAWAIIVMLNVFYLMFTSLSSMEERHCTK
ncbi:hypothetical protein T4D_14279 [Trichinella pseudospiralis]|uniref:Uncharacterized protein n=2 Tax=Trichinella pseudospiralis TaxID=6337 RepID=A0A0V1FNX0_TRIPS|nr:hypothetical protein T4D_14279 [Trichinella pseudospiralis]